LGFFLRVLRASARVSVPASIIGSIAIWFLTGGQATETQAHGERFGIFVGLWAPTFFILSNRFDRFSEKAA
jgi:hypothetical protein